MNIDLSLLIKISILVILILFCLFTNLIKYVFYLIIVVTICIFISFLITGSFEQSEKFSLKIMEYFSQLSMKLIKIFQKPFK